MCGDERICVFFLAFRVENTRWFKGRSFTLNPTRVVKTYRITGGVFKTRPSVSVLVTLGFEKELSVVLIRLVWELSSTGGAESPGFTLL